MLSVFKRKTISGYGFDANAVGGQTREREALQPFQPLGARSINRPAKHDKIPGIRSLAIHMASKKFNPGGGNDGDLILTEDFVPCRAMRNSPRLGRRPEGEEDALWLWFVARSRTSGRPPQRRCPAGTLRHSLRLSALLIGGRSGKSAQDLVMNPRVVERKDYPDVGSRRKGDSGVTEKCAAGRFL